MRVAPDSDVTPSSEETAMTAFIPSPNPATASQYPETDPRHHTAKMGHAMRGLMQHLRDDAATVQEPRARVLFETSAEVLGALAKAFDDYERREEPAFR
jgi:hypothetical protein